MRTRQAIVLTAVVAVGAAAAAGCEEPALLAPTFALCATPEKLSFGEQLLRTPITQPVVVTNCGTARIEKLTAQLIAPDPGSSDAFTLVATDVTVPVRPGERFALPIQFRPEITGPLAAELTVTAPDGADVDAGAVLRVAIDGVGAPLGGCDVLIGPDPIDFGAVIVGESVQRDITLTNQGTATCALSGARVTLEHDEFFEITTPPPADVAPGDSVVATIRFAPREVGERTGRFAVVVGGDAGDDAELEAALTGTGVSGDRCALIAEPSPIALPRTSLGVAATEASSVVRSVGELPCTIASVAIAGEQADEFSVLTAPAAGVVLAPAASSALTVRFTPVAAGPRDATLQITTAEGTTLDVPLSGFADPAPTCALVFDPATVSFAPLAVGLSAEADVTFRNASDITCTLQSVTLAAGSEPDFSIVSAPPLGVIAPGDVGTARIRFTAQLAAPALGRLQLGLDGGVTSSVDLLGFGDFAELVLTPGFVPFGIITQGCVSDVVDLTLTNVGPVAARIDDVAFTAATDPNFVLLDGAAGGGGALLEPGTATTLRVRMDGAPAAGPHHGALEVRATGTRDAFERAEMTGTTDTVANASRTDVFTQRERPIVDILFVIDNSGSMSEEQANLALNFGEFIQFTSELDIDYQIGVTTTDASGANAGRLVGPIIANSGPNASADPIGEFVAQSAVGTNGSANEAGLKAAALAVTDPVASQAPNAGFVRDGALLSIIFVTDEEDHSTGDVGGYLDTILGAKDHVADAVVASAIAGDVPSGCDSADGDADAATRYLDVVTALQGVFASICASDWATTMEEIGLGTFQALTRFQLSREPDPSTMVVTVDGVVVPESELNGWSYDADSNSVKLNGTAVPAAGAEIEISYVAECLLPGGAP